MDQSLFVFPRWFSAPPESLAEVGNGRPAKLWVPLQAGAAVALGAAIALNRHDATRRRLLRVAAGCYAATWISTGAYFAPEIIRLSKSDGTLPAEEVARRGRRWMNLTWLRQPAMAASWILVASALARCVRPGPRGAW